MELTSYDAVCALEEMLLTRRFLPYAVETPSEQLSWDDQRERANFIFFADSHADFFCKEESTDNVRRTIDYANRSPIPFDALINAGDVLTPFGVRTKEHSFERAKRFFDLARESKSPLIFAKGNHDLNDWDNLPENVFTDRDWGTLFLDYAEETYGIHRQQKASGDKSTWHYYDVEKKKIRIIAIDIQDTDKTVVGEDGRVFYHGGCSWYISNEQINWLASCALNFDDKEEKDWGVIFVLHHHHYPKDAPFADIGAKLLDLCVAFRNQSTYEDHSRFENSFFDWDLSADFTRYQKEEKKPHIICWLVGHEHMDGYENEKGIHIFLTLNGSATSFGGDARVARIPGTATQNSFDILNIDTTHRRIRLFRYGAAKTCYGEGGDRFLPDGLPY